MQLPRATKTCLALGYVLLLLAPTLGQPPARLALVGGTLIDGTGAPPLTNSVVLIEGERITAVGRRGEVAIPEGTERAQLDGRFLLPGLIDGHVHLQSLGAASYQGRFQAFGEDLVERIANHAKRHLQSGVTTVFDVGGPLHELRQVRDEINQGKRPGARIFMAGPITSAERGYPLPFPRTAAEALHQETLIRGEFKGIAGARTKIRQLIDLGVDQIKVYQTGGFDHGYAGYATRVPLEELKVVVELAHQAGIPVTAHTRGIEGFRNGVRAGLDSMQHVVYCGIPMPDEIVQLLAQSSVYIIPTIVAISQFWDLLQDPSPLEKDRLALNLPPEVTDELFEIVSDPKRYTRHEYYNMSYAEIPLGRENLSRLVQAGARVAMGTDAGTVANFHGTSYREVVELVRAGMTSMQAIMAATRNTALAFKKPDLGTIEAGKIADIIVLAEDPLADIQNLSQVLHVFKSGKKYK